MKKYIYVAIAFFIILLIAGYGSLYRVNETEQVIITQFGKPVGGIDNDAGLKIKVPFIQKALQYFLRLRDERSAQSRLDDILGGETRNAVAKHKLIEIIRTTKGRESEVDPLLVNADRGRLLTIKRGRRQIEEDIYKAASGKLSEFGIELLDIRFKRINYNESVRQKIYARMISERQQIAERFRSEGAGEAAKIIGSKEKELQRIESEAYQEIQTIQGVADAKATAIYTSAYNQSKYSQELYTFVKTLETYRSVIDANTTLVLTTESDIYGLLKGVD